MKTISKIVSVLAFIIGGTQIAEAQCTTITCPGDITVSNDMGICGAVVNYTTPVGTDASNILFVSDGVAGTAGEIPAELTAAGYNVTTVYGDHNSTTKDNTVLQAGGLSNYSVIFWHASGNAGFGDTHSAATFTALDAYVTAGGAVFVTGYDVIASPSDPELIAFMGGTSSTDGGTSGSETLVGSNTLTTGVTNIVGLVLSSPGDHDGLNNIQPGTVAVATNGTSHGWAIRTLGAGEIAWVSTANSTGSTWTQWNTAGSGYKEALLNFAFNHTCGPTFGPPVTTMTAGLADGSVFPVGATTVTYQVVDGQGNNAQTCSFIVTVTNDLSSTATSTDVLSGNDGTIDLVVTGGASPYTYLWDDVSNSTTEDLTGLAAGTYTVIITDANGCTDTLSVIVGSQLGVSETENTKLTVYPNPTADKVTIEFAGQFTYVLTSVNGDIIYSGNATDKGMVSMRELAAGIYFIVVNGTDKIQVVKN